MFFSAIYWRIKFQLWKKLQDCISPSHLSMSPSLSYSFSLFPISLSVSLSLSLCLSLSFFSLSLSLSLFLSVSLYHLFSHSLYLQKWKKHIHWNVALSLITPNNSFKFSISTRPSFFDEVNPIKFICYWKTKCELHSLSCVTSI